MRGFWPRLFVALFAPVAIGFIVSTSVFSCYAHAPTPTTNVESSGNPADYPPLHDSKADGGWLATQPGGALGPCK